MYAMNKLKGWSA
jgi:translation initiation factor 4E